MNETRFRQCIMPLQRRLYAYALSILEDESDAADCIQEVYTKLWEQRARIARVENVEAYALVTVKNMALNIVTRRRQFTTDSTSGSGGAATGRAPDTIEPAAGPAETMEARERLEAVAGMLRTLPENQRRVVVLSALSGLTNSQIREATGLSDDNVRVLLSRGRRKLRELFSKWMQKDI